MFLPVCETCSLTQPAVTSVTAGFFLFYAAACNYAEGPISHADISAANSLAQLATDVVAVVATLTVLWDKKDKLDLLRHPRGWLTAITPVLVLAGVRGAW